MSDTAYHVVRIDVLDGAGVVAAARRAEAFLRGRGLLGEERNEGWAPGPGHRAVLALGAVAWAPTKGGGLRMDHIGWNHVAIVEDWCDHFAIEAFEPPRCPRCGAPAAEDDCYAGLDDWVLRRREPVLTCSHCGEASLQGDWIGDRANACGAPAVVFHNWEELDPGFVAELRAVLGGRTQVVWQHT